MAKKLKFDQDYLETVDLNGGERIVLRLVRPEDKRHLLNAFEKLSPDSRYKRFFGIKNELSEAELRYFTELDQQTHFALGAMLLDSAGSEFSGAGIARFVRLEGMPETAEVGITVVDQMQGRGIGRLLLERLFSAAIERGVRRLRFECLAENQEMQRLVKKLCDQVEYQREEGILVADVVLPEPSTETPLYPNQVFDDLLELMRGFASDALKLQTDWGTELLRQAFENNRLAQDSDRHQERKEKPRF